LRLKALGSKYFHLDLGGIKHPVFDCVGEIGTAADGIHNLEAMAETLRECQLRERKRRGLTTFVKA